MNSIEKELYNKSTQLLNILIRSYLSSKRIIYEYKFNRETLDWIFENIKLTFAKSLVQPGETVGTITAQAISEPTQQMTLNTFHYAGVSSKGNLTRGVPSIQEILSLHKENKTSSLTIFLKEEDRENKERAKEILGKIEYSLIRNFLTKTEIYFEVDPLNTTIESDKEFIKDYRKYTLDYELPEKEKLSKWVIRFELDSYELAKKKLRISEIIKKIKKESVGRLLHFETTDENADIPVIRIMIDQVKISESNKHNKDESAIVTKLKMN